MLKGLLCLATPSLAHGGRLLWPLPLLVACTTAPGPASRAPVESVADRAVSAGTPDAGARSTQGGSEAAGAGPADGDPGTVTDTDASPAVVALLGEARLHAADGDLGTAAAAAERALRLEPRAPAPWVELAAIRLAQRDLARAESLALRALSLGPVDPVLRRRACRILEQARQGLGRPAAPCGSRTSSHRPRSRTATGGGGPILYV